MSIYVNGDSNAAGDELVDEQFPGWPGYQKYGQSDEFEKAKKWFTTIRTPAFNNLSHKQKIDVFEEAKAKAWPAILGKLLNTQVINNGQSGSCQASITYRTMMDLIKYKTSGHTIDKMFIMLTSHMRIETYGDMWGSGSVASGITSLLPFLKYDHFKELTKFSEQWDKAEPDYGKAARFLTDIILLREYIKGQLNIEPIFLDSNFLNMLLNDCENVPEPFNTELQILIEQSQLFEKVDNIWQITIDRMDDMRKPNENVICPSYHFAPIIHERFAEHLFNKYFKE